jgi:hypothetical protein
MITSRYIAKVQQYPRFTDSECAQLAIDTFDPVASFEHHRCVKVDAMLTKEKTPRTEDAPQSPPVFDSSLIQSGATTGLVPIVTF